MINNPIKDNRIVHDMTFAIRLRSFVDAVNVYDLASEEEKKYILAVADKLISYQTETVTDESEKKYLTNIHLL